MVGELLSRLRAANSFTTARIAIKRGKQIRGKRGRRNFRSQRGEGRGGEGRVKALSSISDRMGKLFDAAEG